MPEPLDPTDAIYSAFGGVFVTFGTIMGVSLGGHVLGSALHWIAPAIAALPSAGLVAFGGSGMHPLFLIVTWFATFIGSFATWFCWPFLIFDAWLILRLRCGMELFTAALVLALVQPLHSLLMAHRFQQLAGTALAVALGLWLVLGVITAGLALWWRRVSSEAPEPEPEPEL